MINFKFCKPYVTIYLKPFCFSLLPAYPHALHSCNLVHMAVGDVSVARKSGVHLFVAEFSKL